MLELDRVSLVTIATKDHPGAVVALNSCLNEVKFSNVVVFTNDARPYSGHLCFPVSPRTHQEWCVWRLTELPRFRDRFPGQFILFIESDSRLVNPSAWTDEFYKYDYIGAPWKENDVGNGGFTLMSQRFLTVLSKLHIPPNIKSCYPCDWKMCRNYKPLFESAGCKYAPVELAHRFSNETGDYLGAFGVHSHAMIDKAKKCEIK